MISTLIPLEEAVEQQLSPSSKKPANAEFAIDELCKQVLSNMFVLFRQIHTPKIASQVVNQCYVGICNLMDQLWHKHSLSPYFKALKRLYFHFQLSFSLYLQPDNTPPLYLQQQLSDDIQKRLRAIRGKLASKAIPEHYIQELQHAIKSLFNPNKQPPCYYAHLSYLPRLMDTLEELAHDKRHKAWTDRYVFLLIRFNFNYMGFYNRWQEQQDERFEAAFLEDTVSQELIQLEAQLKQYSTNKAIAFCLHHKPLLNHMWDYLHIQKKRFKQRIGTEGITSQSAITLQLNGQQTKLLFHAFYAADLFPTGTKEEIAKTIVPHIRTASDIKLTAQSLSKYDREKMISHAPYLTRKVKLMLQFLEQNFK